MSTNSTNSTALSKGPFSTLSLGNGLVEIGALTTLIGSSITESFVLGNHGAAGLAWATTSAFGIISAAKGCISGTSPAWLRQTLGLRTKMSDLAVGMDVGLSLRGWSIENKVKGSLEGLQGLSCTNRTKASEKTKSPIVELPSCRAVYAFDNSVSNCLKELPAAAADSPFEVYTYADYPFARRHHAHFQVVAILVSALKLVETCCLWRTSGPLLAITTSTPWAYFFLFALAVEIQEIIFSRLSLYTGGNLDVLVGQIPSVKSPGGSKTIFLGAVQDPRTHTRWRLAWLFGAIICISSVVVTYFILAQQTTQDTFVWAAFQALWFILRIAVYHLSSPYSPMAHRAVTKISWKNMTEEMKDRALHLVVGVATLQVEGHPRETLGPVYGEDCLSAPLLKQWSCTSTSGIAQVASVLSQFYTLRASVITTLERTADSTSIDVQVHGVIGDAVLSSLTWVTGGKLSSLDLYDCCVIIITRVSNVPPMVGATPSVMAIPAVRVLSCTSPKVDIDPEHTIGEPQFIPRGTSGQFGDIQTWHYWVPCCIDAPAGNLSTSDSSTSSSSPMWLYMQSDNLQILGKRRAWVLSDFELDRNLAAGRLNIGFKGIQDVKDALELSRRVALLWWQWYGNKS